jgi:hypothetical protein
MYFAPFHLGTAVAGIELYASAAWSRQSKIPEGDGDDLHDLETLPWARPVDIQAQENSLVNFLCNIKCGVERKHFIGVQRLELENHAINGILK